MWQYKRQQRQFHRWGRFQLPRWCPTWPRLIPWPALPPGIYPSSLYHTWMIPRHPLPWIHVHSLPLQFCMYKIRMTTVNAKCTTYRRNSEQKSKLCKTLKMYTVSPVGNKLNSNKDSLSIALTVINIMLPCIDFLSVCALPSQFASLSSYIMYLHFSPFSQARLPVSCFLG